jgi:hypothetical protein
MITEIDLLNCPTIFEAVRQRSARTVSGMAAVLQLSYQTVRRLCYEPGTPRSGTLKSIRKVYPFINSARWRRWVYLISKRFDMDVLDELEDLLSTFSIDLDAHVQLADTASESEYKKKHKSKAISFYLHDDHLEALALLSAKLGKSQAQLIRDFIDSMLSTHKDVASKVHPYEPKPALITTLEATEDSILLDMLVSSLPG